MVVRGALLALDRRPRQPVLHDLASALDGGAGGVSLGGLGGVRELLGGGVAHGDGAHAPPHRASAARNGVPKRVNELPVGEHAGAVRVELAPEALHLVRGDRDVELDQKRHELIHGQPALGPGIQILVRGEVAVRKGENAAAASTHARHFLGEHLAGLLRGEHVPVRPSLHDLVEGLELLGLVRFSVQKRLHLVARDRRTEGGHELVELNRAAAVGVQSVEHAGEAALGDGDVEGLEELSELVLVERAGVVPVDPLECLLHVGRLHSEFFGEAPPKLVLVVDDLTAQHVALLPLVGGHEALDVPEVDHALFGLVKLGRLVSVRGRHRL
mmetsp:Transcript_41533/g.93665  ORF Transcript_41533/g.93665 Transcript_41533/m.93665 type:complete len:328 (+) Transcript_41533:384-1367(+)